MKKCVVFFVCLLVICFVSPLHSQFPCRLGCDANCSMTYAIAAIGEGCTCPPYYECIPVETCDDCRYNGMELCIDPGYCVTYEQTTFNMAFGCCAGGPIIAQASSQTKNGSEK